jgi:fatty-acyl-CoA synthase
MKGIANRHDVLALEAQGLPVELPANTYEMIRRGAAIDPSAPALSFYLTAAGYREAECWTYSERVRDITRTSNLFTRLGGRFTVAGARDTRQITQLSPQETPS